MNKDDEAKRIRQADIVMEIAALASELDWCIAVPDAESPVAGMLMGTKEWIKDNAQEIYGPSYVMYEDSAGELLETMSDDDGSSLH